ncbi:hypothetical protein SLEP1_g43671 [Rubroshorea leprosula]|uniref:Uncharacterized protein n=1 Tax=Rubroshorea leprosula TaxID=152421 RepID=A0AAV5LDU9_9ROSI|nr:hypothetical protein SLEP1_g43671 [Rubroshorea leprosula]
MKQSHTHKREQWPADRKYAALAERYFGFHWRHRPPAAVRINSFNALPLFDHMSTESKTILTPGIYQVLTRRLLVWLNSYPMPGPNYFRIPVMLLHHGRYSFPLLLMRRKGHCYVDLITKGSDTGSNEPSTMSTA